MRCQRDRPGEEVTWSRPVPMVGDISSAAERAADPRAWRFGDSERRAFYDIVNARRDIRRFRPDALEPDLVERVLSAAHAGPSVGHSQPWRFVLVGSDETRERASLIAERERRRQAGLLTDDAQRRMLDLKLDGIRDAPLGLVVCCDRRTAAAGVLGRATFPDTDLWSCACAIENLWLAARAEGLGLGWVTLFGPDELAALVGLPDGVETLGWLCLGWPDERPPGPGLERAGWSRQVPLEAVVLHERWSGLAPAPPVSRLRAPDQRAVVRARDLSDDLLTPPGSLGVLDEALQRLIALGTDEVPTVTLVLVAADHPVTKYAVSTYPISVTREVLEATVAGESLGAAAARAAGFDVVAVDAGVDGQTVAGALDFRPGGPGATSSAKMRCSRATSTVSSNAAANWGSRPQPHWWHSARWASGTRPLLLPSARWCLGLTQRRQWASGREATAQPLTANVRRSNVRSPGRIEVSGAGPSPSPRLPRWAARSSWSLPALSSGPLNEVGRSFLTGWLLRSPLSAPSGWNPRRPRTSWPGNAAGRRHTAPSWKSSASNRCSTSGCEPGRESARYFHLSCCRAAFGCGRRPAGCEHPSGDVPDLPVGCRPVAQLTPRSALNTSVVALGNRVSKSRIVAYVGVRPIRANLKPLVRS